MTEFIPYIFMGAGLFFFLYFLVICRHCGYAPDFSWFWLFGGTVLFLVSFIANAAWFTVSVLLACFFLVSFLFLAKQGNSKAKAGAEYVIVLGAKVNGCVPSLALKERIRKAYEYLSENPHTKAILTGGQGRGEDISEALAMVRELTALGIEKERLYIEDKSTTTLENIAFAKSFIENKEAGIVIITSDFHTLRGKSIAKAAGFTKVDTLGAKSSPVMCLHYYTRETLSWLKYGINRMKR